MRPGATIALALCACSFHPGAAPPTDVAGDATSAAARKQMEVVSGGGRVMAGTITLDVQVGHGVLVRKSTAGTITISGAPVVTP